MVGIINTISVMVKIMVYDPAGNERQMNGDQIELITQI